jgi:hypothetical protein
MSLNILYIFLIIFHPILLTIIVFGSIYWLLVHLAIWPKYKQHILRCACIAYALDTALALPRGMYSARLPSHAVVHQKIPMPKELVLIHTGCSDYCHHLLFSGQVDSLVLLERDETRPDQDLAPVRMRAEWVKPGACPRDRWMGIERTQGGLLERGYCPLAEKTELPAEGIFIVQESFNSAKRAAAPIKSKYLTSSPPGRVIEFFAHEVQKRSNGKIEVLATRSRYSAPGLTGLPPLIGCWERPDNIIWIMPPGDTGCGFWRWFTSGGDQFWSRQDLSWIFEDVLIAREPSPTVFQ